MREQNSITHQLSLAHLLSKFDHVRGKKTLELSNFDHARGKKALESSNFDYARHPEALTSSKFVRTRLIFSRTPRDRPRR